jgi:hypothetical protein
LTSAVRFLRTAFLSIDPDERGGRNHKLLQMRIRVLEDYVGLVADPVIENFTQPPIGLCPVPGT